MTNQEINERVAKLCGLDPVECHETGLWHLEYADGRKLGFRTGLSKDHAMRVLSPHYAESLDACREFECSLSEDDRHNYGRLIGNLERFDHLWGGNRITALITVTALERCEAFLRLKGQLE